MFIEKDSLQRIPYSPDERVPIRYFQTNFVLLNIKVLPLRIPFPLKKKKKKKKASLPEWASEIPGDLELKLTLM